MIYIIAKQPFPYGMAPTQRILCYAKALISVGEDVKVVIACATENGRVRNRELEGIFEGVPFCYLPRNNVRKGPRFLWGLKELYDNIRYYYPFCLSKVKKNDKVLLYGLDRNKFALRILHLRGVKTAHELCEYPGYGRKNLANRYKKWSHINNWFKRYDGFICISEGLYNLGMQHKKDSAKIIKIPALFDGSDNNSHEKKNDVKVPYIFFAGKLDEKKDAIISTLSAFFMAKQKIKDKPLYFYIAGDKTLDYNKAHGLVEEYGFSDSVFFLGRVSQKEVEQYQEGAFLSILNRDESTQNIYGFSTKLATMLFHGTPVIATKVGEIRNWLEDNESVFFVEPSDTQMLADKIVEAVNNPEKCKSVGEKGRKIAQENFDCINYGYKLKSFFEAL